jgi:hypothetical protein
MCLDVAKQRGVGHAQLPISDYMELKTRQVLTVNQGLLKSEITFGIELS